jgi:hypothetical protein
MSTAKVRVPSVQRRVLYNASWKEHGRLLRALQDRRLRLTYDRGGQEIMTLSFGHERYGRL